MAVCGRPSSLRVDGLHGEVEVYDSRGRHLGVAEPIKGQLIKPARRGRTIDV
jgi:hypothetical protein